jgi:endonuclease/exonuclease/phosphatase family metal-dependent hydrolase
MKLLKITRSFLLFFAFSFFIFGCNENKKFVYSSDPNYITIATLNCEWLGDGINDNNPRSAEDYENLAKVIADTKANLIALQEVENPKALRKILQYLPDYKYICGKGESKQKLAFLYGPDIKIFQFKEYPPLNVEFLTTRPGLLAYCQKGNLDFWIMDVHLKSTSGYDSTFDLKQRSYQLRTRQAEVLNHWLDSILSYNEKDIIILGDFNDNPKKKSNQTLDALANNPNIEFQTADFKSCKNHFWNSIDHIIISKNLKKRILAGSLMMLNTYNFYGKENAEKISDHCPVIMSFEVKSPDDD